MRSFEGGGRRWTSREQSAIIRPLSRLRFGVAGNVVNAPSPELNSRHG